jgi:Tfp pilus assembly protein PilF/uncharacterized membrane protein
VGVGPTSLQLVGNWKFAGLELGRPVEIVWQLRSDGSCTCLGRTPKIGTWRHADGNLYQTFPDEAAAKAKVDIVDANTFILTAMDEGTPPATGVERRFIRRSDAEYHCSLGVSHMRRSPPDHGAALKELDEAVRLNGSFAEAYNERGHVRHARKDFAGAMADYTKALELRPNTALLHVNRASVYFSMPQPDHDAALKDLDEAIRLDPSHAEAYNRRANVFAARREFAKAIGDYDKAITLEPKNAVFYANRGKAYLQSGMVDLGNKDLASAKRLGGSANPAGTAAAPVTELSIRNKTTENVFVAVAYKRLKGDLAVEGWHAITPEQVQTFRGDEAADMYLRIERPGGREVTFAKNTTFLSMPASSERFTVSRQPDDDAVWVLRTGAALKDGSTIRRDGPLPAGWSQRRFFRADAGSGELQVTP